MSMRAVFAVNSAVAAFMKQNTTRSGVMLPVSASDASMRFMLPMFQRKGVPSMVAVHGYGSPSARHFRAIAM